MMHSLLSRFTWLGPTACCLLTFTGCREQVDLKGVGVVCQRYEGKYLIPVNPQSHHLKTVENWRKFLDTHSSLMGKLALGCPTVENTSPKGLKYGYHTAWEDTVADHVVLYYFAPIPNPKVYAGYGIDAVVGIQEGKLKQVCVFPVPLE